jgi:hypothetical protein
MVAICVCAAIFASGCNKDSDDDDGASSRLPNNKISVDEVEGAGSSAYFTGVEALLNAELKSYEWVGDNVGSAGYKDGSFTITLSSPVSETYLEPVTGIFEEGITISNPDAMLGILDFLVVYFTQYGYSTTMGLFHHGTHSESDFVMGPTADVKYVYADRNVSVKGSGSEKKGGWTYNDTYDINLKQGWNTVYHTTDTEEDTNTENRRQFTGSAPSGLKWYYERK